jgi:proline iminopeptidase
VVIPGSGFLLLAVLAFPTLPQEEPRVTVAERVEVVPRGWVDEVPQVPRLDEDMDGRYVDVGGVRLYVLEEGAGTPLVLLNGGPGNSLHSFLPHFSRAAGFARVIYYDPRGVGLSDWERGTGYSAPQALDDLEALRARLGIEHWAVLGWSWGGQLAQLYALRHPERVLGVVLVCSSASMRLETRLEAHDPFTPAERLAIRRCYDKGGRTVVPLHSDELELSEVRLMVYNGYRNGDWKRQFFTEPTPERMAQVALHAWVHDRGYNRALGRSGLGVDLTDAFLRTPIPFLVTSGEWDTSFPRDHGRLLAGRIAGSRFVHFERSSHDPFSAEPDRFFELLREFLAGLGPVEAERIEAWQDETRKLVLAVEALR